MVNHLLKSTHTCGMFPKFLLLTLLSCVVSPSEGSSVSDEKFPSGTFIDDWFRDTSKVWLEQLGKQYVLTDYGVLPDSTLVQTREIQAVIDRAAQECGGVIIIPRGTFLSGNLFFKPGTRLWLQDGARLKGSRHISDFQVMETRIEGETCKYFPALVNADKVDGFVIGGKGTIDGDKSHIPTSVT